MNRLRCFLFATVVLISSATFALGGDIQGPGKSDPPPPPPASTSTTASIKDDMIALATERNQIAWQDWATAMLRDLLLTIY
jgi:hypothetical protein